MSQRALLQRIGAPNDIPVHEERYAAEVEIELVE